MLVQFSFSNFKCFKEESTLNLVAQSSQNKSVYSFETPFKYSLLKTIAVYGANASGKTKLFDAINFMKSVICPPKRGNSVPVFDYWQTKYDAFRLNTYSQEDESLFEAVFILNDIQYRYGFTINDKQILSEWLYQKKQREIEVFYREGESDIKIKKNYINPKIFESVKDAGMISPSVPLLSILSVFNDKLAKSIEEWFKSIVVISANDIKPIGALTNPDKKGSIVAFLKAFDINIDDVALHEIAFEDMPDKIKAILRPETRSGRLYDGVKTTHKVYNESYERSGSVDFSMENDESFGTNRLFSLSWSVIKSLREGTPLIIDELDCGIHTNIVKTIIELYYSSKTKAQLIFNTQNSSLLGAKTDDDLKLLRKDQIYLVNKNIYGESSVYPASDYKNDLRSNVEKIYLDGGIAGVPFVRKNILMGMIGNRIDNDKTEHDGKEEE